MIEIVIIALIVSLFIFYFILTNWDKHKIKKLRRKYGEIETRAEQISKERRIDITTARGIAESELSPERKFGTSIGESEPVKPKRRGLFQRKFVVSTEPNIPIPKPDFREYEQESIPVPKPTEEPAEPANRGKEIRDRVSAEVVGNFLDNLRLKNLEKKENKLKKDGTEKRKPGRKVAQSTETQ